MVLLPEWGVIPVVLLPTWGVKSAPFASDLSAKIDAQQRGFVFSGQYVTRHPVGNLLRP